MSHGKCVDRKFVKPEIESEIILLTLTVNPVKKMYMKTSKFYEPFFKTF